MSQRIIIIGAGIGGLTLANGLHAAGLDVEVHERSQESREGLAGYGIHINADGACSLHECLPPEAWERFDAAGVPARDIVRFHDEHLQRLAVVDHDAATAASPVLHRRAVGRLALRDALVAGLQTAEEPIVHWGHTFDYYERLDDGRIRASFTDGTAATGDLLIGADGSNSRVRRQYLPDLNRVNLGVLNIAGRHPLTDDQCAAGLPAEVLDTSVNCVVPAGQGWIFFAAWPNPPAGHSGPDGAHASGIVVWAYAAARRSYPDDIEQLTGDALQALVLDRIDGWSPALRTLVEETRGDTITPIALRSMGPLPHWGPSNVTLLGDAIHNMTPMAGIGANTALRDAALLRRTLLAASAAGRDLVEAVGQYEAGMRVYANQALKLSTRNAHSAASESRLPRLGFRTALRVANAVPPVNRAMFGNPTAEPAPASAQV
jgi:2-polyprenyl-6-methoxyphenol hydroxylase-like FAD-dependent oxidoreductase